jgi:hypothetical protein
MPTKMIIGDATLWLGDCLDILYGLPPVANSPIQPSLEF